MSDIVYFNIVKIHAIINQNISILQGGAVPMSQSTTTEQLLRRVHYFISEGQIEDARLTLEKIQAENTQQEQELAYLHAWHCTLQGRWDDAAQFILSSNLIEEKINDIHDLGQTERRRRAHYLLMMGNIAVNLQLYDEAVNHYLQCIKFLDERRMNDQHLRIKALYALGTAYTETGLYVAALTHYKEALDLCNEDSRLLDQANIYHGLCITYTHLRDFTQALDYGNLALQGYIEQSEKGLEGRVRNLLGNICYQKEDYDAASKHFTEALGIAALVNSSIMVEVNLASLANARRSEGILDEAQRYCHLALDYLDEHKQIFSTNYHVTGMTYLACGQVAQARAEKAQGTEASELLQDAKKWYQKAIDTLVVVQGTVTLAKTYRLLAQILEDTGQQDQAFAYWKRAYAVSSQPE